MKYLSLVRYQNLILLALMQLVFRYGFLEHEMVVLALNDWQYLLLVLATVLIAAAGYVINDIFDQEADAINRPNHQLVGKSISETAAYNLYVGLNLIGVGLGFYLSNVIEKPSFATIFIFIAACLYFYATTLKGIILVGNFVVAFILALSVLIIGVFDLYPMTFHGNQNQMRVLFSILTDYAVFAFLINFIREIIKDAEDVKGDFNQGIQTLPIILGINRTAKVIFGLLLIPVLLVFWYINTYLMQNELYLAVIYLLVLVLSPLLYSLVKSWNAKTIKEFHHLSQILKIIIFFGICSILVITYTRP
ncbi:geranylgeranylglycerol-phosphate geranylgeranyltransferase [Flavobacterium sp.]|uniref:geranylgeranylglycerol-phosphate geranylgeranyltransferase n=1 Tax=Flavobacterium sp. TaxID=239 RepID=UPI0026323436|nr:geranylgeranylglycerol-phosphate geranylgeranyltransferase [Flavobacterium sp.]MDD2986565.1 geranylgeranylglycerol-phosphate geranylgeranyltransferase [Flavobacterium sp.]